jgi:isoamylase
VQKLTGLRHKYPILRRSRFLSGEYNEELEVKDAAWINATGEEMREENWNDGNTRVFGMLLDGRAQSTGIRKRGEEATLLIIFNPWHDVVKFKLPEAAGGDGWKLLADTNFPDSTEEPRFPIGHEYEVTARSLLLFGLN